MRVIWIGHEKKVRCFWGLRGCGVAGPEARPKHLLGNDGSRSFGVRDIKTTYGALQRSLLNTQVGTLTCAENIHNLLTKRQSSIILSTAIHAKAFVRKR